MRKPWLTAEETCGGPGYRIQNGKSGKILEVFESKVRSIS